MADRKWLQDRADECRRMAETAADPMELKLYRAMEREFLERIEREYGAAAKAPPAASPPAPDPAPVNAKRKARPPKK
jgi:hypothetical protein